MFTNGFVLNFRFATVVLICLAGAGCGTPANTDYEEEQGSYDDQPDDDDGDIVNQAVVDFIGAMGQMAIANETARRQADAAAIRRAQQQLRRDYERQRQSDAYAEDSYVADD